MTGSSLLQDAVDELYSSPMAEFTARRKALATAARKSGERETATQIAGLRKPTLSADTLNRLVRTAPDEVGELIDLGAALRAAEKALDGARLRELSADRRRLVSELTQLAFDITDQSSPSASVRDEVIGTLNAALADVEVADRLLSGSLVTQASWDGFGSTSLPELATVLPLVAARRSRPTAKPAGSTERTTVPSRDKAAEAKPEAAQQRDRQQQENEDRAAAAAKAAARARSEAEAAQHARLEAARREAREADEAAGAAQEALSAIDRRVGELSLRLAHERRLLADAQQILRSTQSRQRAAQLALTRAGGS